MVDTCTLSVRRGREACEERALFFFEKYILVFKEKPVQTNDKYVRGKEAEKQQTNKACTRQNEPQDRPAPAPRIAGDDEGDPRPARSPEEQPSL